MTHAEFVALVASMREAQKAYFKRRSPSDLDRPRSLEREVDHALKDMRDDQPKLFQ